MTQPRKFSHEFQQDIATAKVFHHKLFALYGNKRLYIYHININTLNHSTTNTHAHTHIHIHIYTHTYTCTHTYTITHTLCKGNIIILW